ncbi:CHAT domain-containing protein, partial [Williamsia sp.]|uniref:CHAT domain-containing protein n=1 Tax=Williamsia sp. TaxID=1872085 RepID=UPI002F94B9D7
RTQFARHHLGQYACLADSAMSAYLPTIAEFSCGLAPSGALKSPRLLYVSTDAGTQTLDHAEAELDAVRGILRDVAVTHLSGADATIEAVGNALPGHPFLHVTAHGSASAEAFASGVRLADGVLTLGHLADLQVARGELAVFLTCDSARGSAALPNEALHVAGAAMQTGYPNVVATSIPLRDSSAVTIATAIYTAVAGAREGEVGEAVARAMHDALAVIRDEPTCATDPLQWAPLAYFGWGCNEVAMP